MSQSKVRKDLKCRAQFALKDLLCTLPSMSTGGNGEKLIISGDIKTNSVVSIVCEVLAI